MDGCRQARVGLKDGARWRCGRRWIHALYPNWLSDGSRLHAVFLVTVRWRGSRRFRVEL